MKTILAITIALFLAGCASAPRPQMMIMPHKAPIAKAAPEAPAAAPVATPDKPATFKDRWQEFRKKHPIKWTH